MTDSKGAAIDEILRQLEVDLFEVVGDEFAPKQENGSPERKRLLGSLSKSYPIFAEARQAILAILAQEVNHKVIIELTEALQMNGAHPGDWEVAIRQRIAELEAENES